MRILAAIANHGVKNERYVQALLAEYRSMSHDVDVVVLSNVPKELGNDVEVVVGAPTKDPWSLPFGYKEIFKQRRDDYDLFIYSEDDTLIEQRHIDAFLRATEILPQDLIAGFLRYERSPDGTVYYSTIHGQYHWDPASIATFGDRTFARYTNDHSACFIITKAQLHRGLECGGFMKGARQGTYDMLCTAATDPYTQCGMTKVICVSHLEDSLLHHLPDIYLGKIGITAEEARREIDAILEMARRGGDHPSLIPLTGPPGRAEWNKPFYDEPRDEVIGLIPAEVKSLLSVGSGWGATEEELARRGLSVAAIPLNEIARACASARGVASTTPDLRRAIEELKPQTFDCLLIDRVLHHLPDPAGALEKLVSLLNPNGYVLINSPNFHHFWAIQDGLRPSSNGPAGKFYEEHGYHRAVLSDVKLWIASSGLRMIRRSSPTPPAPKSARVSQWSLGLADRYVCPEVTVLAKIASILGARG